VRRLLRLLPWAFVPAALAAHPLGAPPAIVFVLSCLAILPLASLIGHATGELSRRLGPAAGGLLNASFGNAAELIIALTALQRGLHDVVKASLTGSIIGNVLLVLGASCLAGGLGRERQTFDRRAAAAGSTLLALAAIGLVVPAMFHVAVEVEVGRGAITAAAAADRARTLSLVIAFVLAAAYVLSLLFSLRTHRHLYAGEPIAAAGPGGGPATPGTARAVLVLLAATVLVAWMSELLVGAVVEASHALGLTEVFVGVVVVAVIGNAAEHSTAVLMAMKNQMDLAMNIAIGSSLQVALFVAPVLVFASRLMPGPPMDLVFTPFEVLAVGIAVAVVNLTAQDGESNWLEGALLVAVYLVLALAFFFLP
jgi:Ca2+:H+ antiporter